MEWTHSQSYFRLRSMHSFQVVLKHIQVIEYPIIE